MTITLPPPFVPGHSTLVLFTPHCDFCKMDGNDLCIATFDATIGGVWGYACTPHFLLGNGKTGMGRGQALIPRSCFDEATLERIRRTNREL